jgi:multimeric flavodoxin WrbA
LIVGVCGSPRQGATAYVLSLALQQLEALGIDTAFFTVRGKRIGFCMHCDHCLRERVCVLSDDMSTLYPLLRDADGVIFATPVYNSGVSAQTKAIMDRCRALLAADAAVFRDKVGMAIAVGGDRMGGQEPALQQIIAFYVLNGMIPVSGGPFGANLGATFWSRDSLDGVKEDVEGVRSLKKTVTRFARYLQRGR